MGQLMPALEEVGITLTEMPVEFDVRNLKTRK
jgi:hypothetical protein